MAENEITRAVRLIRSAGLKLHAALDIWERELAMSGDNNLAEPVSRLKIAWQTSCGYSVRAGDLNLGAKWDALHGELKRFLQRVQMDVLNAWDEAAGSPHAVHVVALSERLKSKDPLRVVLTDLKRWNAEVEGLWEDLDEVSAESTSSASTEPAASRTGSLSSTSSVESASSEASERSYTEEHIESTSHDESIRDENSSLSKTSKRPSDQDVLTQAEGLLSEDGVIPSTALKGALFHAINGTTDVPMELTPWQLLLGLIQGARNSPTPLLATNASPNSLQLLLLRRLRQNNGDPQELWLKTKPNVPQWPGPLSVLSDELEMVLQRAKEIHVLCTRGTNVHIATRHVVAAIAEYFAHHPEQEPGVLTADDLRSCLVDHLPEYKDEYPSDKWNGLLGDIAKLRPIKPKSIGTKNDSRREAGENELCLDINRYASAIQSMFVGAEPNQDFVFALFGPWGRGKSTLMRKAAELMKETHEVVFFSAVKYPSRPEVWVHLYQKMMETASMCGFWRKWQLRIRMGLLRTGWWPLLIGVFAASLSGLTRLDWAMNVIQYVSGGLGIVGLMLLLFFSYRIFALGRLIHSKYGDVPDHSDKLGLQAVVGEDLDKLLRAWLPSGRDEDADIDFSPGGRGRKALTCCLFLLSAGCSMTAYSGYLWLPNDPWEACRNWTLLVLVLLALLGFTYYAACQIASNSFRPKRILLIVDDLDRCDPEQAFSVVESIRWFLDEPKISSRMQVAMLMEKESLAAASKKRARAYRKPSEGADWEDWFQSLCEKLFMVELNMVNLTKSEVNDLMDKVYADYAPASEESASQQAAATSPEMPPVEERQGPGSSPPLKTPPGAASQGTLLADEPPSQEKDVTLTPSERDMMKSLLKKIHAEHLTPRSVRAVVSRYLFARKLLRSSGSAASEHDLMKCLFESIFKRHLADQEQSQFDPVVQHLVAQLVGAEPVRRDSATQG